MIQTADEFIQSKKPHYVVTANLNYLALSLKDPEFRDIILTADRITADGMPVIWASKLLGCPLKERVTGSDMGPELAKLAAEKGYSIFLLGGEPEVAKNAVKNLTQKYPKLRIAGYYSPPFNPLLEMNEEEIFRIIKDAKPDILLVSLAGGKTEKWIRMNYVRLNIPFAIGVGATIDFIAGKVSRAPKWMQRHGLEWLYRLVNEPKRLFKRYAGDGLAFGFHFFKQYWYHVTHKKSVPLSLNRKENAADSVEIFKISGTIESEGINKIEGDILSIADKNKSVILDLSGVSFIDSKGIGFLIGLKKRIEEKMLILALAGLMQNISKILRTLKLYEHFRIFDDEKKASEYIVANALQGVQVAVRENEHESVKLSISGRINSQTRERLEPKLFALIDGKTDLKEFRLDFSEVEFLDSSGLSMLIKVYKHLLKRNVKFFIENTSPFVQKILTVSQAYKYLNLV